MAVKTDWAQRVSRVSQELTRIESELLDYITRNPQFAAFFSLKELCESTGISKPKVIDFYKKLQYTNFKEFRDGILEFYEQHINSYQASSATFHKIKTLDELIRTAVEVDVNALSRIPGQISTEDLAYVSRSILDAQKVYVYGPGTGYYPAHFLAQRLKRYRIDVHLIAADPQHLAEELFPIGQDDLLLIYHYFHEEQNVLNVMDFARDAGANTIMVSEHIHHSFVERADRILYVNRGEIGFKNSMAVPMAFTNLLLLALELTEGEASQETLKELERKREAFKLSFHNIILSHRYLKKEEEK